MEDFLIQYGPLAGYAILLLGSFVEGESIVLTAGFFAFKGYLSLPLIMMIAFTGSVTADQILFFLGRAYGPGWLAKKPHLKEKADKAFALLIKYNIWFIMGFRFIYGIRTISPFVIGTSGISIKRFAILNIIAGAIWAVSSCLLGYMLGYWFADEIEQAIKLAIKFQKIIVTGVILLLVGIGVWHYYRKKQKHKNLIDPDQSNR